MKKIGNRGNSSQKSVVLYYCVTLQKEHNVLYYVLTFIPQFLIHTWIKCNL